MSFINKTCTTVSKAICFSTPSRHCPHKGVIHFHLKKQTLFFNRIKMQDLLSASLSCIYITPSLVQKMHTNKIKMLKKSDLCLIYCESNTWKTKNKYALCVMIDSFTKVQLNCSRRHVNAGPALWNTRQPYGLHLYGYIHIEAVTVTVPSPPILSSVSVHMLSPLPSRVSVNEKMMRSVILVISSCS